MSAPARLTRDGHVAILTLASPETRNAITELPMVEAIVAAIESVQVDAEVRALIVTGEGPAFSSGGNVKHMRDRQGTFAGDAAAVTEGYRRGIQRIPLAMQALEVPAIAAVNGPAFGAGCDLTLMCDIRIASTAATFAENFVRVGLIPGDGGAHFLPRAVGWSRACEMSFTGEAVDAATALSWGLVSRVVEPQELLPAALDLARRIAINPPMVLRQTKRLLREAQRAELRTLLELAASLQGAAHQSTDHREAIAAMFEKRPPRFTGK